MTSKSGAPAPDPQDEAGAERSSHATASLPPAEAARPAPAAPDGARAEPADPAAEAPEAEALPDAARQWIDDRIREAYHQAEQEALPAHLVALLRRLRPTSH